MIGKKIGRDVETDDADGTPAIRFRLGHEPAFGHGKTADVQILVGGAEDVNPVGDLVPVPDVLGHIHARSDAPHAGHLFRHGADLFAGDFMTPHHFLPFNAGAGKPTHAPHVKGIRADKGDILVKRAVHAVDGSAHQSHRGDADDDAKRGEGGTHFVRTNGVPRDSQTFFYFEEKVHERELKGCCIPRAQCSRYNRARQ